MSGRRTAAALVALIAVALAVPASGGIVGLRPGGAKGLGPSQPAALSSRPRPERPHWRHKRPRRPVIPVIIGRERVERETVFVPVPVAIPAPPPRPVIPEPPPDPRGPAARLPARGVIADRVTLTAGDTIDGGVPLVMLDWRGHALPEPAPGDAWVRLGRQVVLIEIATRRVVATRGTPADGRDTPS
jgi:Ni/Co efflux regulator RcnB